MAYFKVVGFILREWTEEATKCVSVGLRSVSGRYLERTSPNGSQKICHLSRPYPSDKAS